MSRPDQIKHSMLSGLKSLRPKRTPAKWWLAEDWMKLAAMLVTLGIAIWSVDQAGWVRPSTSLVALFVLAALTAFVLVKTGLPSVILHPLAILIGLIVIFCLGLSFLPGPGLQIRTEQLVSELQAWWQAQVYGAPSPVTLHIALIFGFITWLTGYISAWSLLKKGNPWVAVLLGIVIVLVNLNFWSRDKYYFFLIYIVAALVLLAVVTFLKNRSQLAGGNFSGSRSRPGYWLATSLCLIIITVSLSWVNPGFRINPIADYARAHDPFRGTMELYWQSFFAPVPGSNVPTLNHGGQRELLFGGPLDLSDQVVFIINTDSRYYWKTQVYDLYSSSGWKTGETQSENIQTGSSPAAVQGSFPQNAYLYTLIPQVTTDVLPTVGEFVSASVPALEKVLVPQVFTLNLLDASADAPLPPDIAAAARNLRSLRSNRRRTDQQIADALPSGLKLESINRSGSTVLSITVSRLEAEEKTVVSVASAQILLQQKRATLAVTPPPAVTAASLEKAGEVYPQRITDRYLQLPTTLPPRIRALAAEITQKASTPYQKAQDIKKYLGTLTYDLSISAPAEGEDGVDYFLFTQKAGYCNYFASAAAVLLRSSGVPARMVVGFMPGQYDSGTHSYIIRDRDYHAWIEIYYPGEGWVEMDVTPPSQAAAISSSGSSSAQDIPFPPFPDFTDSGQGASPAAAVNPSQPDNFTHLVLFMTGYILIVLFLIFGFHFTNRPRNKTAIYARMVFLASLAGLGPKPRQTELEFSRQLSGAMPHQADVITRIVNSYINYRYAREAPEKAMDVEFKKSWPGLRWDLIKRIFRFK
jgi:transglutaminase-like putative cysteine protease